MAFSLFGLAVMHGNVSRSKDGAPSKLSFARDVLPILSDKCFRCHGPDEESREADLRLDERRYAVEAVGAVIAPGDAESSELIRRIMTADVDMKMPPADSGLTLSASEIATLRRWVDEGAAYTTHWSFRPVLRPPLPVVHSPWVRNPIDSWVLRELRRAGLEPSPEADRTTLIRRLYLDLLGLLPPVAEVDQFVDDDRPDAYERLVDRLLSNPHFGERWGRHWLDQARYADTNGYTIDSPRSIWPYRDWVINAFNRDMPFDEFTIEQLAGDLLKQPTRDQLIATGFHRNTLVNQEGGTDREQFRVEAVVDRVNTTGTVWLGLTVNCAQCHSHKFDPLSQREYYQLFSFFNHTADVNSISPTLSLATPEQAARLRELDAQLAQLRAEKKELSSPPRNPKSTSADGEGIDHSSPSARSAQENDARTVALSELDKRIKEVEARRKQFVASIPTTMIMRELSKRRDDHILIRGDFLRKGEPVKADVPHFLPPLQAEHDPPNRLDLARWLVRRDHPLTPRVTANRIWMHLMGRGIVETENDFGLQGTPPTHPELLDYLSAEFVDGGWSFKHLIRLIVTSSTYRQDSAWRDDLAAIDPTNRLYGRQARLRLEAEIVRDAALSASGLLCPTIGGPSVYPPQPAGVYAFTQRKAAWPTSDGESRYRRGMYTFFMRSAPYPQLTTFDVPRMNTSCTRRARSNTPLQALTLANSQAFVELAQALGRRVASAEGSPEQRVEWLFQRCLSRKPNERETLLLTAFFKQQLDSFVNDMAGAKALAGTSTSHHNVADMAAWVMVSRAVLNLDEFITRE